MLLHVPASGPAPRISFVSASGTTVQYLARHSPPSERAFAGDLLTLGLSRVGEAVRTRFVWGEFNWNRHACTRRGVHVLGQTLVGSLLPPRALHAGHGCFRRAGNGWR